MQSVKIDLFEFGLEVDKRQNHGGFVEKFNPALKRSAARRNNPASSPWVAVRGGEPVCQVDCRPPTPLCPARAGYPLRKP